MAYPRGFFYLRRKLERIPSYLVPVPKKGQPTVLNDIRPVALTSHTMKTMERLVLAYFCPLVKTALDPLQFAYQDHTGVYDAVTYFTFLILLVLLTLFNQDCGGIASVLCKSNHLSYSESLTF